MSDKAQTLRKILSLNIKKYRELHGITQEKLAEKAGISANMMNDIEGCRTWVSDKTLVKLCSALQIDCYRLLISLKLTDTDIAKTVITDVGVDLQKIRKYINNSLDNVLKSCGLEG